MELFEAMEKRHSYRKEYTDTPIPKEDLLKIVEAGRLAPSGKNAQTTTFVIVDDPEILREFGEMLERPASMKSAKAAIVLVTKPERVFCGHTFHLEDMSAAAQNMLLAATALGYASVWVQGGLLMNGVAERINELLNVPVGQYAQVLLPIGVPAEEMAQPVEKPLAERVVFNRF
ncbi:MAG: nitroreductase family protein [Planctomycetia bacterium]|nr:nitroreductase family protein [Planctomycetia bacterium]